MRDEGLKPCPFCGGEAELVPYPLENNDTQKYWAVICANSECPVSPESPYYHKTEAIEAWNRRANEK